ncbi:hypothetical protein [Scrofimicrobium canadense]|uniref:hypothetical protein n=1 Tax=Scrofimicrobium canadense TaxID=2652290 RepID=UPI0019820805|nr:hypothetical protein [Scrofimicrobium canadense]
MLRNVRQPQLISAASREAVPGNAVLVLIGTEVIMDRRSRLSPFTSFLPERRPPAILAADRPSGSITHALASVFRFVSQEAMTELRIIPVSVKQRISPVMLASLQTHSLGSSTTGSTGL